MNSIKHLERQVSVISVVVEHHGVVEHCGVLLEVLVSNLLTLGSGRVVSNNLKKNKSISY